MSGLLLQLQSLSVPFGTEFPGTVQELLDLIAQYEEITGGENFNGVNYGPSEPDPDNRALPWFKTQNDGTPIGWYGWNGSDWAPIPSLLSSGPTSSRPSSPQDGTEYFDTDIDVVLVYYGGSWHTVSGSPGDVKFVTGTSLSAVLLKNPGWSQYTEGIGKAFIGAQADGSDAEDDVGSDSVVLTENQMPAHTHGDIQLTGSDADNGDAGDFVITAATSSIGVRTIAASVTGSTGGSDPVDVRQASRILFCLVKD